MEYIPDWIKSLIGGGVMIFIAIQGFRLTSNRGKNGKGSNGNNEEKK